MDGIEQKKCARYNEFFRDMNKFRKTAVTQATALTIAS